MIPKNMTRVLLTFTIMFIFWIILSGFFDPLHISFGIISSLIVTYFSHDYFLEGNRSFKSNMLVFIRFIKYILWLSYQIIIANIEVTRRILDPKLSISPGIVKISTNLKSESALTTLANSITLTPGTLTMDIIDGEVFIHCLLEEYGVGLSKGEFEKRIKAIYEGD
ncbi:MAG: Na+/H+ antiporter subunit E [Methanosarcinaceae archaeon]|nr:Na+/H+ antiporter subunit E [Methanosarcinaceae archaeon]NKQ39502.1 Na+/H+ antiporter subunit E [Methanosarcinales archaeon]